MSARGRARTGRAAPLFALVLVGLMGMWSCARERERPELPNIIIYLVDTLRADHLGVYGYARDTTPALDAFARDAVVFDMAYSPTAWTRPACASLLSGLNPPKHRAITRQDTLSPDVRILSEYVQPLGFRTAGFVANPNVIGLWGFDQGYDHYEEVPAPRQHHARAGQVTAAVLAWLDGVDAGPFFLYVHIMDPHGPFAPPPPYDTKYPRHRQHAIIPSNLQPTTPRSIVEDAKSAYDGEIAYSDFHFGRLMRQLKKDGLYDDALIIFTADHGEELQDHGGGGHGHTLYQELVHVPFLIKFPGNEHAGRRVDISVSLVDVVPTILGLLGVETSADLDGIDLMPLLQEQAPAPRADPLYLDLDLLRAAGTTHVLRGVVRGSKKYIRRLGPVDEEMLFDVAEDPEERENLLKADPQTATALAGLLDAYTRDTSAGIHVRLMNAPDSTRRTYGGVLRTRGRFVDLSTRATESDDRVAIAPGGQTLAFQFVLENRPHPQGERRLVVDEDRFVFNVEPADAEITVERLDSSGGGPAPLYMGPTRQQVSPPPFTFRPTDTRWAMRDVAMLLRENGRPLKQVPAGVYVAVVPDATRRADVPDAIEERLRALGYVGAPDAD